MEKIVSFDFGNITVPPAEGYIKVERVYRSPRYLWINHIWNDWRKETVGAPWGDFVYGQSGEFRLGLPKGKYKFVLYFYDSLQEYGPFRVILKDVGATAEIGSGKVICSSEAFRVDKCKYIKKELIIDYEGGCLGVHFSAEADNMFIVNALEVYCEETVQLQRLFEEAPSDILPSKTLVESVTADPEIMLKNICSWFMENRHEDGFIGDSERLEGLDNVRLWYTAAYPIRTLLAAYDLYGDDKYLIPAIVLMDMLVSEQMPRGGFTQVCRGIPTSKLRKEQIEQIESKNWMNLADVGSIVLTLVSVCRYVNGERYERYVASAKRYCDEWASSFFRDNGGFDNGWLAGTYAKNIYSVATSNSALTHAFLYYITGETKYLKIAEKACMFMMNNWNDDGRPLTWAFDGQYPNGPGHQRAEEFGDVFYTLEAIVGVVRISNNPQLKKSVYNAFEKYIFGSRGILAVKGENTWWPLSDVWTNSKSVGIPIVLQEFIRLGRELKEDENKLEIVQRVYDNCIKFLCSSEHAMQLGVMLNQPTTVHFEDNIMASWACCSVAATGFAGISIAEMIKPGVTLMFGNSFGGMNFE